MGGGHRVEQASEQIQRPTGHIAAPIRVGLVARRESGVTGTSRYVANLLEELQVLNVTVEVISPEPSWLPGTVRRFGRKLGIDVEAFLQHYPLRLSMQD